MGVETGLLIGSQVVGAGMKYAENKAARKRASQQQEQAKQITDAPDPVQDMILKSLMPRLNQGQDSFLQYLRANPGATDPFRFDTSQTFKDLQAQDAFAIGDQAAKLSSSAGSLGSRFGTGFAAKEALLRSRFAADTQARNAGISQSSYDNALRLAQSDYSATQTGNQNQTALMLQALLGAGGLENQRRQQKLAALGIGGSGPSNGDAISGLGIDIAQLLALAKYTGGKTNTPAAANVIPNTTPQLMTWNPNWSKGF